MIKKIKEKVLYFWKKAFFKDIAILQAGALFSTGLAFVGSVIFTRFLGPSKYGIYGLVFAFTGLVGMFMDVGTGYAGVTLVAEAYAKKDLQEVKNILTYFIKVDFLTNFIIGGTGLLFAPYLTNILYGNSQIGVYAQLVLGAMIIRSMFSMLVAVLHSTRKIASLTTVENANKFFYKFLPIVFVLSGMGVLGIAFGHFITAAIFLIFSVVFYGYISKRDELLPSLKEVIFNPNKVPMWKYFKFGFQIAIDKNLTACFSLLPMTFLGMFLADYQVGYFKLALSYITIPVVLIGPVSRILNVQLPKSQLISKKLLKEHFVKTSLCSMAITTLLVIPFVLMAPILIKAFYGAEFIPSIKIAYLLSFYVVIYGLGTGIGPVYRATNKMKSIIKINSIVALFGIPVVYWLIKQYGITGMIWTQIFWHNAAVIIAFFYAIKFLNKEIEKEEQTANV